MVQICWNYHNWRIKNCKYVLAWIVAAYKVSWQVVFFLSGQAKPKLVICMIGCAEFSEFRDSYVFYVWKEHWQKRCRRLRKSKCLSHLVSWAQIQIHNTPKVVGFLGVLRFPPTGNLTWCVGILGHGTLARAHFKLQPGSIVRTHSNIWNQFSK